MHIVLNLISVLSILDFCHAKEKKVSMILDGDPPPSSKLDKDAKAALIMEEPLIATPLKTGAAEGNVSEGGPKLVVEATDSTIATQVEVIKPVKDTSKGLSVIAPKPQVKVEVDTSGIKADDSSTSIQLIESVPAIQQQYPTYEQFCAAVDAYSFTKAGGHPKKPGRNIYDEYIKVIGSVMPFKEQAMLLANVIWESGGLQYLEEIACKDGHCPYGWYYGRGYIQLTWHQNYWYASWAIYGDDRLWQEPDLVARVDNGWKVTLWYWQNRVSPKLIEQNAIDNYQVGTAAWAINGNIECGKSGTVACERLRIYNAILDIWGINHTNPGRMDGCLPDSIVVKEIPNYKSRHLPAPLTSINDPPTVISSPKGALPESHPPRNDHLKSDIVSSELVKNASPKDHLASSDRSDDVS